MSDNKTEIEAEINSLNLDNLDVEELEHRLEMAMASPNAVPPGGCDGFSCYIN